MKHRTNHVLYAYWNDVRGERIAPRRFDIEPSQIAAILAETFILEFPNDGNSCEFRLAGTKICEQFGREFRGQDFFSMFDADSAASIGKLVPTILKQGGVVALELNVLGSTRAKPVAFEAMLMPLIHTDNTITRVLGAIAAANPPEWLGHEPLGKAHLKTHHVIWPDGRPFAVAEQFREPAPLVTNLSGARLVRFNRRSFRVLDGGLGRDGNKAP